MNKLSYVWGFQPRILLNSVKNLPAFLGDISRYQQMQPPKGFLVKKEHLFPILTDKNASAGSTSDHYFHQDLWAAKKIFARNPGRHLDVGSRIDGFIAHLLAFRDVTVMDIRPLDSDIAGLTFFRDDATEMQRIESNSVESLSSLHAAEHFGLGRYGDPIDPHACFRFMEALQRVLAPGGRLYFSVPIGRERVEFNAHRVFDPKTIIKTYSQLELVSFSAVGDDGKLRLDCAPSTLSNSNFACGLFEFTKRSQQ